MKGNLLKVCLRSDYGIQLKLNKLAFFLLKIIIIFYEMPNRYSSRSARAQECDCNATVVGRD